MSTDTTELKPSSSAQISGETKISSASKQKVRDFFSNYKDLLEGNECGSFDTVDVSGS